MQQIADFHIHSRYSRACSKDLTLVNIDKACRTKGVDIIGTGDFTYPKWFEGIKEELEIVATPTTHPNPSPIRQAQGLQREGNLLLKLKSAGDDKVKFILTTELALIYKDGGKCRRIHIVVHAPNIAAAEELNKYLDAHYNIRSDGRPILGMSAVELFKICLAIHPLFLIYPAHIWTPWFSVFGSKSGFDSLEECFHEYTDQVCAYETGLSSDPEMNWRVSALDRLSLLSNSDAHSLPNIAREANVFELESGTYDEIYNAIKNKDLNKIKSTIEFYPEEGMYHLDGHRDCKVSLEPSESKKRKGICPVCNKSLVLGVLYRVGELADRDSGYQPNNSYGFQKLVELDKIIAESLGVKSRNSIKVKQIYAEMINKLGNELDILRQIDLELIKQKTHALIAEGIKRVRSGQLIIKPGFDGQYGEVRIFGEEEIKAGKQEKLI